jgi:hypothetical protein
MMHGRRLFGEIDLRRSVFVRFRSLLTAKPRLLGRGDFLRSPLPLWGTVIGRRYRRIAEKGFCFGVPCLYLYS